MQKYMCAFALLGLLALGCAESNTTPTPSQDFVIKRGGNFTGLFQYGNFDAARFAELKTMKDAGVDFIRLPLEPTRFYDLKSPDWANLVVTLNEAERLGLRVIVDLHPLFSTQRLALTGDARYPKLIADLARLLGKRNQALVALELMNEPIAPSQDECDPNFDWNAWQKKFFDAARSQAKDLTLILTGACWGGIDGLLKVKPIADPKLIYSIHNYDPFEFTHQGASWTGPSQWYLRNVPYPPTPQNVEAVLPRILYNIPTASLRATYRSTLEYYGKSGFGRASMTKRLGQATEWATRNKARIFMGEFGVLVDDAPPQDRVVWMRDMREVAESLNIPHSVWDFSVAGNFGPYRNGKPEAAAFQALGLTPPANAIATPPNPTPNTNFPNNPVAGQSAAIADFENGNANLVGTTTKYFSYGKPDPSRATPAASNGGAPVADGQIVFDYGIPANNEYGGVGLTIPVQHSSSNFTHVRFDAAITGGQTLRVALASSRVDTGGDHPQVQIAAKPEMETFTIPFTAFRQGGWGKTINPNDVLRDLDALEITALDVGTSGQVRLDNVALVKIEDAANPPVLDAAKRDVIYDFELPNQQGNNGGSWYASAYQENAASVATNTTVPKTSNGNSALEMNFDLPKPNGYAGALVGMPFGQPRDLSGMVALRLELSATGTRLVRLEFSTGLDTGNDNPQVYLVVSATPTTYRVPLSEFAQAGWGKRVNVAQALQNATGVVVYADTVGTKGTVRLDNVVLERQ